MTEHKLAVEPVEPTSREAHRACQVTREPASLAHCLYREHQKPAKPGTGQSGPACGTAYQVVGVRLTATANNSPCPGALVAASVAWLCVSAAVEGQGAAVLASRQSRRFTMDRELRPSYVVLGAYATHSPGHVTDTYPSLV
jgi:hypothetical protein